LKTFPFKTKLDLRDPFESDFTLWYLSAILQGAKNTDEKIDSGRTPSRCSVTTHGEPGTGAEPTLFYSCSPQEELSTFWSRSTSLLINSPPCQQFEESETTCGQIMGSIHVQALLQAKAEQVACPHPSTL
jgi:hypothetical protein